MGRRQAHEGWEQAEGVALPEGGDQALERIWVIAPGEADGLMYAGGDPGVLFESADGGSRWEINAGLWEQPTRPEWQPGGGGLCLHSIAPGRATPTSWPSPSRPPEFGSPKTAGARGGGATRGSTRATCRRGERRAELAERRQCRALRAPRRARAGRPERMFMQFHGGVYRSDDAG